MGRALTEAVADEKGVDVERDKEADGHGAGARDEAAQVAHGNVRVRQAQAERGHEEVAIRQRSMAGRSLCSQRFVLVARFPLPTQAEQHAPPFTFLSLEILEAHEDKESHAEGHDGYDVEAVRDGLGGRNAFALGETCRQGQEQGQRDQSTTAREETHEARQRRWLASPTVFLVVLIVIAGASSATAAGRAVCAEASRVALRRYGGIALKAHGDAVSLVGLSRAPSVLSISLSIGVILFLPLHLVVRQARQNGRDHGGRGGGAERKQDADGHEGAHARPALGHLDKADEAEADDGVAQHGDPAHAQAVRGEAPGGAGDEGDDLVDEAEGADNVAHARLDADEVRDEKGDGRVEEDEEGDAEEGDAEQVRRGLQRRRRGRKWEEAAEAARHCFCFSASFPFPSVSLITGTPNWRLFFVIWLLMYEICLFCFYDITMFLEISGRRRFFWRGTPRSFCL